MLTSKTEKQLKNLGPNSYEVKLWVALLSRGTPTAGELSNISGVPKSRSYDVLKSLEEKGFVAAKAGKPIRYSASPPQEVVGKVKQRIQFNANDEIKNLVNLNSSRVANELVLLYERGAEILKSEYTTSSLQGKHNIYNHLESIIKYASKSILISLARHNLPILPLHIYLLPEVRSRYLSQQILNALLCQSHMSSPLRSD